MRTATFSQWSGWQLDVAFFTKMAAMPGWALNIASPDRLAMRAEATLRLALSGVLLLLVTAVQVNAPVLFQTGGGKGE